MHMLHGNLHKPFNIATDRVESRQIMKLLVLFIVLAWSEINLCTATGDARTNSELH